MPDRVKRNKLSETVINLVMAYYCNDNSRLLPVQKDYVSIRYKVHMPKRLLLCNLKELYSSFKLSNSTAKIGFSKFASLRPKWCITAGPKGTHSVCVGSIHQNVKLLLSAIGLEKSYHELIELIVCNRNSKICMIHRCEECPGIEEIQKYLNDYLLADTDDNDINFDINFNQWVATDRSNLVAQTLPVEEFISLLSEQLNKITAHSFIAKAQSKYLYDLKINLPKDQIIVILDFSENFKFLVQDEVQGFHWNGLQCTMHPVAIYSKSNENKLIETSICFISYDLNHDVCLVYQILSDTVKFVKQDMNPNVSMIHYFSDGCAGQYKNCKNVINICFHKKDFFTNCSWNFFATSHGKSPCDAIGGTVKRITAKASFQRTIEKQILSVSDM